MFYSHVYLRKNGRFGLVWLAATQSRVLSRRELTAVNVSLTVSNILEHVPGNLLKDANRPRRFSLYLSSQLMYGSVKVLQKQWEFLLGDLTSLLRKFHPEISPTTEIDLIIARPEPVTLESYVPSSIKDKYYDPFFGVFKENIADVQALLAIWDDDYVKKEPVSLGPAPFKAELGSPHSVSDLQQIQILDHPDTSLSIQIPGEQDLPYIDPEHLAFIQAADQQIDITAEDLITPAISRILENQNASQVFGTDLTEEQIINAPRPVEETPAVKITRELPGTPKKSKRKQRDDGDGGRKKPRNLDAEEKGVLDDASVGSYQQKSRDAGDQSAQHLSEDHGQQRTDSPKSPSKQPDEHRSPSLHVEQPQENWLKPSSGLQLSPIPLTPSPVRKRQPHKLIIDETLQMSRLELKKNMNTSNDTCNPLALPTAQKKDLFKEPGSEAFSHLAVRKMWTRNCKFGLRVSEHDKAGFALSDISPLESPRIKRKDQMSGYETPAKLPRTESVMSGPASMEKGRDISDVSGVSQIKERSTSLIGQVSDDSAANISVDQQHISSLHELDRSLLETSLAPLPEEQEQIVSPVALEVPVELQTMSITDQHQTTVSPSATDDMQSRFLRVVREKTGSKENWTTFRTLCPPNTSSRRLAITLFQELCWQVAKGVLQVRQDEPYGEIFIWESDESSLL